MEALVGSTSNISVVLLCLDNVDLVATCMLISQGIYIGENERSISLCRRLRRVLSFELTQLS